MSISSDELFHFTKLEYSKSILKDKGFYPRYSPEFVRLQEDSEKKAILWAIPMVCFCDIPYRSANQHRKRYGSVGIAMTEEWKLRKRLNPVLYLQSESHLAQAISKLNHLDERFNKVSSENSSNRLIIESINEVAINLNHLSYFIKQFENKNHKEVVYNGSTYEFEKRRFYDEREWRFIPFEIEKIGQQYIHNGIEILNDPEKLKNANILLKDHKLSFEFSDIEYILVKSKEEKLEINNLMKEFPGSQIEIKICDY